MADYATLQSGIETVITGAGYVVSPAGSDPERIPAHGAGSWVAVDLEPAPGLTASNGYAREAHQCRLSMVTAIPADRNASRRTALDRALALRELLDSGSALSSVSAHSVCEDYELEEMGASIVSTATFTINATTTVS